MKTKTARNSGNQSAKPKNTKINGATKPPVKKPRPLDVTFTGDLADELRDTAKHLGQRASSTAAIHLRFGLLGTGTSKEAREYRRDTAAHYVGLSRSAVGELHTLARLAERDYVAKLRLREHGFADEHDGEPVAGDGVTVQPVIRRVPRVEVEVLVPASLSKRFSKETSEIQEGLGSDLGNFAFRGNFHAAKNTASAVKVVKGLLDKVAALKLPPLSRSKPLRLSMSSPQWDETTKLAENLGVEVRAVVVIALTERADQIAEFRRGDTSNTGGAQ